MGLFDPELLPVSSTPHRALSFTFLYVCASASQKNISGILKQQKHLSASLTSMRLLTRHFQVCAASVQARDADLFQYSNYTMDSPVFTGGMVGPYQAGYFEGDATVRDVALYL